MRDQDGEGSVSKCVQDPLQLLQSLRLLVSEFDLFPVEILGTTWADWVWRSKRRRPGNWACFIFTVPAVYDWSSIYTEFWHRNLDVIIWRWDAKRCWINFRRVIYIYIHSLPVI